MTSRAAIGQTRLRVAGRKDSSRIRRAGGASARSSPAMSTWPVSSSMPASARSRLVLPAPFGPITAIIPGRASRSVGWSRPRDRKAARIQQWRHDARLRRMRDDDPDEQRRADRGRDDADRDRPARWRQPNEQIREHEQQRTDRPPRAAALSRDGRASRRVRHRARSDRRRRSRRRPKRRRRRRSRSGPRLRLRGGAADILPRLRRRRQAPSCRAPCARRASRPQAIAAGISAAAACGRLRSTKLPISHSKLS